MLGITELEVVCVGDDHDACGDCVRLVCWCAHCEVEFGGYLRLQGGIAQCWLAQKMAGPGSESGNAVLHGRDGLLCLGTET